MLGQNHDMPCFFDGEVLMMNDFDNDLEGRGKDCTHEMRYRSQRHGNGELMLKNATELVTIWLVF